MLITLMTLTNLMSVRSYGEFEFWFSLLKVGAIALFVAGGAAWMAAGSHRAVLDNLTARGGFAPHGLLAVLATVPVVVFSLTGSEIASIAAAESGDPARNVARASRTVALRIIRSGHSPFVAAMDVMDVPGGRTVMRLIVLVAVLSCLNSGLYVTSLILRELAAQGDAPAALVRTGARQVPIRAILTGSVAGLAASVASIVSSRAARTTDLNCLASSLGTRRYPASIKAGLAVGCRWLAWFLAPLLFAAASGGPCDAAAASPAEPPWWWGAALAPLLTGAFGALAAYLAIRLDSRKTLNQELIKKRIDLYDEVAPRLNDLLCSFLAVGQWKTLPPPVVLQRKRDLDRIIHVYGPLFSQVVVDQYRVFIHKCFRTFNGSGRDALLRADIVHLQKEWGPAWQPVWNEQFVTLRDMVTERELRDEYATLMTELAIGIGTPRRKPGSPKPGSPGRRS